jgi:hypothetical protein
MLGSTISSEHTPIHRALFTLVERDVLGISHGLVDIPHGNGLLKGRVTNAHLYYSFN